MTQKPKFKEGQKVRTNYWCNDAKDKLDGTIVEVLKNTHGNGDEPDFRYVYVVKLTNGKVVSYDETYLNPVRGNKRGNKDEK